MIKYLYNTLKISLKIIYALISFYLIPSIVAIETNSPKRFKVFLLNIFIGWTIIGWIVATVIAIEHIEIHD